MRKIFVVAVIVLGAFLVTTTRIVALAIGSALYIYLLPGVVAQSHRHPRQRQIYIATALAGWLIIPWLFGLLYALKSGQGDFVPDEMPLASSLPND